jgi:hypothetical protein
MTMFQRITKRDSQAKLAEAAAQYQALLTEALEIAKRKAQAKSPVVREILETGIVEGLAANLNAKADGVLSSIEIQVQLAHVDPLARPHAHIRRGRG